MIQFINEGVEAPNIDSSKVKVWIKTIANTYGKKLGQISYIFCSDAKILEVNQQYLNHDYFTDIITFDTSEAKFISGDIFISIDTVKSNSLQFKTDYNTELHRIIIHGILHLCGQDDKTTELRKEMTQKENKALAILFPSK
jgi:rRNA maturation RNase YbeY